MVEYENDLFAGQDRYYTSGVRLTRVAVARQPPDWLDALARRFPGFGEADALPYSLSIGHNIYTPADIENPQLPPADRPYAGWLHAQFATGTTHPGGADRLRIGLGLVGPAAMGKQVQQGIHRVIGADRPTGWSSQLRNEPTLLLGYDRFRRLIDRVEPEQFGADLSALGGITLGNAHTHLAAGGFFRIGHNLAEDYGPPRITPASSGTAYFRPEPGQSWYLYLGVEGRLVARDLFLEGNSFGGRGGVELRRAVGEVYSGVVYTRERLRLAYTHVWRSREFQGQIDHQDYGALSISLWW